MTLHPALLSGTSRMMATALVPLALSPAATQALSIPTIVADSILEFSSEQGRDNWSYGFLADPSNPASFTPMAFDELSLFDGRGTWVAGGASLDNRGGVPAVSAGPSGPERLVPVRRWISEVTGTIELSGRVFHRGVAGGAGIVARVLASGVELCSAAIPTTGGLRYAFVHQATKGEAIDFLIDPNEDDDGDGANFSAVVATMVPEPTALAALCVAALTMVALRARWG